MSLLEPVPALPVPALTPSEDLLIGLLVARHRLEDTPYHLSTRHRATLRSLEAKGLIEVDSGVVDHSARASLSAVGRALFITAYVPPALSLTCRSFYLGPLTAERRVDCTRRNHHGGKHHGDWWAATVTKKGHRKTQQVVVKWTDDQAGGYASEAYGDQLRACDAEWSVREQAAIDAYRVAHTNKPTP